jgi:predicted molibdopterin-dependent oxidoreductase YjgC
MPTEPLFRPISCATEPFIDIEFEGRRLAVLGQRSVAAALLAAGVSRFRSTPVSGAPRAPYCMMGVCFECLLEIDGVSNRQACLVPVQPGMKIRSQEGARSWEAIHTASVGSDENTTEYGHAA